MTQETFQYQQEALPGALDHAGKNLTSAVNFIRDYEDRLQHEYEATSPESNEYEDAVIDPLLYYFPQLLRIAYPEGNY